MLEWTDLSDDELKARLGHKADVRGVIADQLVKDRDAHDTALLITRLLDDDA